MSLIQHLYRLGGIADSAALVALTSRTEVERALAAGEIVRDARGKYAAPVADRALRAAHALSGVVSHRTAALHWGWEVRTVPAAPDVTVPRNRKVSAAQRIGVTPHWATLAPDDRSGPVTSPRRTLADCLRCLPFDEALAVADSALRHRAISHPELVAVAESMRGAGAAGARRVAREASPLAANPFESTLRAIALDVPGLDLRPQVPISEPGFSVQPDLVDVRHRVVAEADSFAWHGNRRALKDDCRRYTNLVVRGWRVLRFSWEDVMHDPAYVRRCLAAVADLADRAHGRAEAARRMDPAA